MPTCQTKVLHNYAPNMSASCDSFSTCKRAIIEYTSHFETLFEVVVFLIAVVAVTMDSNRWTAEAICEPGANGKTEFTHMAYSNTRTLMTACYFALSVQAFMIATLLVDFTSTAETDVKSGTRLFYMFVVQRATRTLCSTVNLTVIMYRLFGKNSLEADFLAHAYAERAPASLDAVWWILLGFISTHMVFHVWRLVGLYEKGK